MWFCSAAKATKAFSSVYEFIPVCTTRALRDCWRLAPSRAGGRAVIAGSSLPAWSWCLPWFAVDTWSTAALIQRTQEGSQQEDVLIVLRIKEAHPLRKIPVQSPPEWTGVW